MAAVHNPTHILVDQFIKHGMSATQLMNSASSSKNLQAMEYLADKYRENLFDCYKWLELKIDYKYLIDNKCFGIVGKFFNKNIANDYCKRAILNEIFRNYQKIDDIKIWIDSKCIDPSNIEIYLIDWTTLVAKKRQVAIDLYKHGFISKDLLQYRIGTYHANDLREKKAKIRDHLAEDLRNAYTTVSHVVNNRGTYWANTNEELAHLELERIVTLHHLLHINKLESMMESVLRAEKSILTFLKNPY